MCYTNCYTKGLTVKLKKRKDNKKRTIAARVTEREFNKIKLKAGLYCEGNLSEWVASAAMNYNPAKGEIE